MKTILAKSPHDSFSFSRRFNWGKKLVEDDCDDQEEILHSVPNETGMDLDVPMMPELSFPSQANKKKKKKKPLALVRSALTSLGHQGNGSRKVVFGTLFGYRRAQVHFAVQSNPRTAPEFLIQLAASTSVLVREMASGLVRIALECDNKGSKKVKLLEEPVWRAYCNGLKCGYGLRWEYGTEEARVLQALEPVSMGAGVIPGDKKGPGGGPENEGDLPTSSLGELMYMRARFERVVGSRDSEVFYMMNPDRTSGPELSFYLLRV